MQVIKFRGWDTSRKIMYSAEELSSDDVTINVAGKGFINVHGKGPKYSELFTHIIPLQFTGLLDKTGKEIFKGDLLKSEGKTKTQPLNFDKEVNDPWWEISEVVFKDGIFGHIIRAQNNSYFGELPSSFRAIFKADSYKEVIGNIYENPELLI